MPNATVPDEPEFQAAFQQAIAILTAHHGRELNANELDLCEAETWRSFARTRGIEHLEGARFWPRLPADDFGALSREFAPENELVHAVVERAKLGADNLGLLCWATDHNLPIREIVAVLQVLDLARMRTEWPPPRVNDSDTPLIVNG